MRDFSHDPIIRGMAAVGVVWAGLTVADLCTSWAWPSVALDVFTVLAFIATGVLCGWLRMDGRAAWRQVASLTVEVGQLRRAGLVQDLEQP